jgi:hypothetical protein
VVVAWHHNSSVDVAGLTQLVLLLLTGLERMARARAVLQLGE